MAFQDVAFLPSLANFPTTFLNNSGRGYGNTGRGESPGTAACDRTVVGIKKVMLHVRYSHFNKASFCVSRTSSIS